MTTGFSVLLAMVMAPVAFALDNGLARTPPMGWSRFANLYSCYPASLYRLIIYPRV